MREEQKKSTSPAIDIIKGYMDQEGLSVEDLADKLVIGRGFLELMLIGRLELNMEFCLLFGEMIGLKPIKLWQLESDYRFNRFVKKVKARQ